MRVLNRTWQMLLKGLAEVQTAGRPIAAAEMVLVRIAYAADLPTPDEAIRALDDNGGAPAAPPRNGSSGMASSPGMTSASAAPRFDMPRGAPRAVAASAALPAARPAGEPASRAVPPPSAAASALVVATFPELIALTAEKRDLQTKAALERDVRLVACEDGKLEIALEPRAPKTLVNDLSRKLGQWTGRPWMVIVSSEQGAPTVKSQADARQAALEVGVRADPLVRAVLDRFPGAEIIGVRGQGDVAENAGAELASPDDGVPPGGDEGFGDNWVPDDGSD
jgi:DNA polymerase-3 subunit gamma/tau